MKRLLDPPASDPLTTDDAATNAISPSGKEKVALFWFGLTNRLNLGIMTIYLGAGALIGIEGLALVISFTSAWPIAVPFVIGGIALLYFVRKHVQRIWNRLRRR